jgi:hypothetical protein
MQAKMTDPDVRPREQVSIAGDRRLSCGGCSWCHVYDCGCGPATSPVFVLCSYKCAVVLCDMSWLDPDMEVANGIAATEQSDMLRLDAMILMVQLNIRKLVEVSHLTT